jgi:hypothetical protein
LSRVFIVLSIATIIWAVLFGINIEEEIAYSEQHGYFSVYPSYRGMFLIVGFVLFPIWVIASVSKEMLEY